MIVDVDPFRTGFFLAYRKHEHTHTHRDTMHGVCSPFLGTLVSQTLVQGWGGDVRSEWKRNRFPLLRV